MEALHRTVQAEPSGVRCRRVIGDDPVLGATGRALHRSCPGVGDTAAGVVVGQVFTGEQALVVLRAQPPAMRGAKTILYEAVGSTVGRRHEAWTNRRAARCRLLRKFLRPR